MAESILVVDDDPDIARFVEVNLRSAGYEVAVAGDGEEALEKAGELRPDLVLLDVMMPRIDGFEVATRLRKNPQTANTSIIMLTAKALSADKVTGLQSGADDYIIKPFDPIELLARVKGTLRRAKEMRNLSPLTGLPGNIRIQDEVVEFGHAESFVGHVGGDDFVAVVPPDAAEDAAKRISERFDELLTDYYDAEDLKRGHVRMEDRKGIMQDIPLVAISIGVAT